ncbi:unnamed protein product [Trichobilharzia szidati]|nr:unnamed protein product [Trichobilharzia szidati]
MRGLLISQQNSGVILKVKPVNNPKGEIISVFSSKSGPVDNSLSVKPSQISAYNFAAGGYKLYLALNSGSLYCLDFVKNWYRLLTSLNCTVTSICSCESFGYVLVCVNDNSIIILDQESGKEIGALRGHTCRISNISIQPSFGQYLLSVALNEAILWDLENFKCRCKLHIGQKVNIVSVNFIPPRGKQIISCFQDGSIYVWSTDSLDCLYRLFNRDYPNPSYRTITFTSKGHYLFAAGRSPFIYLWNLKGNSEQLCRENSPTDDGSTSDRFLQELIKLPEPLKSVRRIEWIPKSRLVDSDRFFNESNINNELSGLLLLLGSDKRLRFLIRTHERPRKTLSCWQNVEKDRITGYSDTVFWKCLFTFGLGSLEDPLVTSINMPSCNILDLSSCQGKQQSESFNCPSLMATLDDHGILHVYDLSMTLKVFSKSSIPLISVRGDSSKENSTDRRVQAVKKNWQKGNSVVRKTANATKEIRTANHSSMQMKDLTNGLLDKQRLRLLLKEFGKFPSKYRLFIWRSVLQLPCNVQSFNALVNKAIHPAHDLLSLRYPIRGQRLFKALQKVCSALAYWCPLFGETDWLPLFVFPFVKLYHNNLLYAFEVVATILINWCGTWFEFFPNPPINILCMIENLIAYADEELYLHFVHYNVTTEIYAWPLLQTALSEVFTQDEWLCLWDILICHSPGLLLAVVAAFSISARGPLLMVKNHDTFEAYYHSQSTLLVSDIVERAHQLLASLPSEIHPDKLLSSLIQPDNNDKNANKVCLTFQPLTTPHYPIITRYPKFIVNYHIQERERIRQEEKEYLRQKATVEDIQRRAELMANEERNWYRQQQLLLDAEDHRRTLLAQEENKLREQRKKQTVVSTKWMQQHTLQN